MDGKKILILTICFIVAVLSILHVIIGYAKTPEGMAYLWTGHYYLDYFYYLTPIAQGTRGYLLAFSQAATDDPTRFIHLWPYTLSGVIGGFLNFSPIFIYWLSVFILVFFLILLTFKAVENVLENEGFRARIMALILSIFAAPFFVPIFEKNNLSINLYDFWYSNSTFFRRFEPIPHHLLSTVLILTIFLLTSSFLKNLGNWSFKKIFLNSILVGLLASAVLSFNSFNMVIPFAAISVTSALYLFFNLVKKKYLSAFYLFIFLLITASLFVLTGLALKSYYSSSMFASVFKNVESALHQDVSYKVLFLSHGPLAILAIFGLIAFVKKINPLKVLLISFFLLSYGSYFTVLDKILGTHNGRFLSPLNYILLGCLAVLAIKKIKFNHLLVAILLIYFLPVNYKVFREILNDRNISSTISYLPEGVVAGFAYLDQDPEQGDVLMTPSQFLGTVMPIYANRRTYVARQIVTPDYVNKNLRTGNFYLGAMTGQEAKEFLVKNGLKYVVLTSLEGYDVKKLYSYTFLEEIYKNKDTIIFKVR